MLLMICVLMDNSRHAVFSEDIIRVGILVLS